MNITEMHVAFNTYAQQMGMQQVKKALPNQIDILLNDQILNTVGQVLGTCISVGSAEVIDKSKIQLSNINSLPTLLTTKVESVGIDNSFGGVSYDITYDNEVLMFIGVDVKYEDDGFIRSCRIIDFDKFAEVQADPLRTYSKRFPIAVFDKTSDYRTINIYCGESNVSNVCVRYIKYPNVVKRDVSDSENNIDCDLPEKYHYDIVKGAASTYMGVVSSMQIPYNNNAVAPNNPTNGNNNTNNKK